MSLFVRGYKNIVRVTRAGRRITTGSKLVRRCSAVAAKTPDDDSGARPPIRLRAVAPVATLWTIQCSRHTPCAVAPARTWSVRTTLAAQLATVPHHGLARIGRFF